MTRIFRWAGKALFVAVAIILALAIIVPPFLDRIYYRGPVSDHFDGQRFFNPDDAPDATPVSGNVGIPRLIRFMTGQGRIAWPDSVPVAQTRVPARVNGMAMRVTWIGHATVLVQTRGLNILTDPIWSDRTGPFALGPRRHRAPGVRFEDLPKIDLVLISHNHYDHLDLPTLKQLWARDRPLIVTGLGNDALLKGAGITAVTRDWGGRVQVRPDVAVIVDRVHHWDSRWFRDRNRALWAGFTLVLPGGNVFFAGDTGYGDGRWPDAVARQGRVRLALLPIGAFKPRDIMQNSHIDPVQAVQVFEELGAANALAIHWGTFQLSQERIDEPPAILRGSLDTEHIPLNRFRVLQPGQSWRVPPIADLQRVSGNRE